jgi:hypothetical protein
MSFHEGLPDNDFKDGNIVPNLANKPQNPNPGTVCGKTAALSGKPPFFTAYNLSTVIRWVYTVLNRPQRTVWRWFQVRAPAAFWVMRRYQFGRRGRVAATIKETTVKPVEDMSEHD